MIRFSDAPPVHKQFPAHTSPVRKQSAAHMQPVTLDSRKSVKIAVARVALAEIGAPAIVPPSLVDTTKQRGRPKLNAEAAAAAQERRRVWNRERMAVRRAAAKAG